MSLEVLLEAGGVRAHRTPVGLLPRVGAHVAVAVRGPVEGLAAVRARVHGPQALLAQRLRVRHGQVLGLLLGVLRLLLVEGVRRSSLRVVVAVVVLLVQVRGPERSDWRQHLNLALALLCRTFQEESSSCLEEKQHSGRRPSVRPLASLAHRSRAPTASPPRPRHPRLALGSCHPSPPPQAFPSVTRHPIPARKSVGLV